MVCCLFSTKALPKSIMKYTHQKSLATLDGEIVDPEIIV